MGLGLLLATLSWPDDDGDNDDDKEEESSPLCTSQIANYVLPFDLCTPFAFLYNL